MLGRSVNITALFLGRLRPPKHQYFVHILSPVRDESFIIRTFSFESPKFLRPPNYFFRIAPPPPPPPHTRTRSPAPLPRHTHTHLPPATFIHLPFCLFLCMNDLNPTCMNTKNTYLSYGYFLQCSGFRGGPKTRILTQNSNVLICRNTGLQKKNFCEKLIPKIRVKINVHPQAHLLEFLAQQILGEPIF